MGLFVFYFSCWSTSYGHFEWIFDVPNLIFLVVSIDVNFFIFPILIFYNKDMVKPHYLLVFVSVPDTTVFIRVINIILYSWTNDTQHKCQNHTSCGRHKQISGSYFMQTQVSHYVGPANDCRTIKMFSLSLLISAKLVQNLKIEKTVIKKRKIEKDKQMADLLEKHAMVKQ